MVSETCGAAGWDGDTGLASSAERREDIPLGPQVLLTLPHSQGPDPWGGPSRKASPVIHPAGGLGKGTAARMG